MTDSGRFQLIGSLMHLSSGVIEQSNLKPLYFYLLQLVLDNYQKYLIIQSSGVLRRIVLLKLNGRFGRRLLPIYSG
jgi:hypothetical protein